MIYGGWLEVSAEAAAVDTMVLVVSTARCCPVGPLMLSHHGSHVLLQALARDLVALHISHSQCSICKHRPPRDETRSLRVKKPPEERQ